MDQTATGPDRIAVELAADLDAGFAVLFEAHQHVLFSTALRICGRWADAEDLTAAAFLRAFRALSGYDQERIAGLRTRPWLLTILLNAWRNQVRTAARRPREVLDAEPPELEARGASAEAQAERHETSRELAAMAVPAPGRLLDTVAGRWTRVPGPAGDVYVASTDLGVAYLRTAGSAEEFAGLFRARFGRPLLPAARPPAGLLTALRTGRAGRVRLDLRGLTPFAASVLAAAATIPRGETRPYGWIARQAGRPRAVRAAASALAANPVPLLIPCHRIVQADGMAGGYVFGTPRKEALLRLEGANLDEVRDLAAAGTRYLASDTTGVVCFSSCRNARRITLAHRHGFASLAAAGRSGFRPCRHCMPV